MNQKERDRLQVLHGARKRQITQREAAAQRGVTERWVRKLLARMGQPGDRAVVHPLRGRVSNRKIREPVRAKAVGLVEREYSDFGPTLASELVQWDTSEHDWLEGRREKLYLILRIDDATSRARARFERHDSPPENLRLLRNYLRRGGRPLAFYTDKASWFKTSRPQPIRLSLRAVSEVEPQRDEQLQGPLPQTQIGRALQELPFDFAHGPEPAEGGIEWIAAHSPQAKGRVERFFGTAQDRLVKGLRKAGVDTLEGAQRYLERVYLPLWNRRFTVAAANPTDAHRPLGAEHPLAAILSHVESRGVMPDYTVEWEGRRYQIARTALGAGLRGARVRMEQRLDGSIALRFREHYLPVSVCEPRPQPTEAVPVAPRSPQSVSHGRPHCWMAGFDLERSKPIWAILRQEQARGSPGGSGVRR